MPPACLTAWFPIGRMRARSVTCPTLLWFRRDLRLHDLPPLLDAARRRRRGAGLLRARSAAARPRPGRGACSTSTTRCANCATASTAGCWSPAGGPRRESPRWPSRSTRRRCTCRRDFSPFGMRRDAAVREALGDVPLEESGSPYLVSPGRVTKGDGTPYKVFTPFYAAWREHGWRAPAKTGAEVGDAGSTRRDVDGRRRHPRRATPNSTCPRARPRRASSGRSSSTSALGRLRRRPQPARPRRHQPDVGAPQVRHHPSAHHGRRPRQRARAPRPICASWRSATSTPRVLHDWPDSAWWNWNKSFDRIEVDEDADAEEAVRGVEGGQDRASRSSTPACASSPRPASCTTGCG